MKFPKIIHVLVFLLITVFLAGDVLAKSSSRHKNHHQKFKTKHRLPDIPEEWTAFHPSELYPNFKYKGLAPACSNADGTESDEFFFYAKRGKVNKVVVYFQGGGACWDPISCLYAKPFSQDCTEDDNPEGGAGIFDMENPDNPFKDWTFVFIPYCTADIHWGAKDTEYSGYFPTEGGYELLSGTIQHRGFVNFQAVLKWMKKTIKRPRKIFVTGSSAGAYGALGGFPYIKEAYPRSYVSLLGDAGMGINPPEFRALSQANWNTQIAPWLLDESGEFPVVSEYYNRVAKAYPFSRVAEFTDAFDGTQIWFYNLIYTTLGMENPEDPASDWHLKMWEGLFTSSQAPNFRHWVSPGTEHTILGTDRFYEEISDDGLLFSDWLNVMANIPYWPWWDWYPIWKDVACEDCYIPALP